MDRSEAQRNQFPSSEMSLADMMSKWDVGRTGTAVMEFLFGVISPCSACIVCDCHLLSDSDGRIGFSYRFKALFSSLCLLVVLF